MDFSEVVANRRSIRKFTNKPIEKEKLDKILKDAMSAPSARNQQAWHFIVVTNREYLDTIALNLEHGKMCKSATTVVVVCYRQENDSQKLYFQQDGSAATQNLLLSATNEGLGSVWIAIHPRQKKIDFVKDLFKIDDSLTPLAIVALGYHDEVKKTKDRFDKNKITYID